VLSFPKREGEEITNVGTRAWIDRRTDRELAWAASDKEFRRLQEMYQESKHTRMVGGRVRHKKATTAWPRPHAGSDSGHPMETTMSGLEAIHSFPASFLC